MTIQNAISIPLRKISDPLKHLVIKINFFYSINNNIFIEQVY